MPLYTFSNPLSGEILEIFQAMDDEHVFIDGSGMTWERVFTSPHAAIDTQIDPHSSRDFIEKTKKKNDSVGALWDRSSELSEKRVRSIGKDPIKEAAQQEYTKKTGKEHPEARKERAAKFLA